MPTTIREVSLSAVSTGTTLGRAWEHCRTGRGKILGARGVKETRRTQPVGPTKQGSEGLKKKKKMDPAWIWSRSSAYLMVL